MASPSPSIRQAGSLDESFANKGKFYLNMGEPESSTTIYDVKAQSPSIQECLYFTGDISHNYGSDYILGRLLPSGALDKSFAEDGISRGSFGKGALSSGSAITLLADGRILVAGRLGLAPVVARFDSDGKLDSRFGVGGIVVLPAPDDMKVQSLNVSESRIQDSSYSVSASADGQILIVKTSIDPELPPRAFAYLLKSDGYLDKSFNGKGYVQVTHPEHDFNTTISSGYIGADGRIMLGGNLTLASGRSLPLIACYTRAGQPDRAYGNGGFMVSSLPSTEYTTIRQIIPLQNDRLLAIGRAFTGEQGLLFSLEADGKPNNQFNRGEPLLTQVDGRNTSWRQAVVQPDGKIVLLGNSISPGENNKVVVARLQDTGNYDRTFNEQGWNIIPLAANNRFDGLTLQKDEKIVISGFLSKQRFEGVMLRFHGKG